METVRWCLSRTVNYNVMGSRADVSRVVAIVSTLEYGEAVLSTVSGGLLASASLSNRAVTVKNLDATSGRLHVKMHHNCKLGGTELQPGLYRITRQLQAIGFLLHLPSWLDARTWPRAVAFYEGLYCTLSEALPDHPPFLFDESNKEHVTDTVRQAVIKFGVAKLHDGNALGAIWISSDAQSKLTPEGKEPSADKPQTPHTQPGVRWCVSRTGGVVQYTTRPDVVGVVAIISTPTYTEAILELDDGTLLYSEDTNHRGMVIKERQRNGGIIAKTGGGIIAKTGRKSSLFYKTPGLFPFRVEDGYFGYTLYLPAILNTNVWPAAKAFYEMLHCNMSTGDPRAPVIFAGYGIPESRSNHDVIDIVAKTLADYGMEACRNQDSLRVLSVMNATATLGLADPPRQKSILSDMDTSDHPKGDTSGDNPQGVAARPDSTEDKNPLTTETLCLQLPPPTQDLRWCVGRAACVVQYVSRPDVTGMVAVISTPTYAEAILELRDGSLLQCKGTDDRQLTIQEKKNGVLIGLTRKKFGARYMAPGLYPFQVDGGHYGYVLYLPATSSTNIWPAENAFYVMLHWTLISGSAGSRLAPIVFADCGTTAVIDAMVTTLADFAVEAERNQDSLRVLSVLSTTTLGLADPPGARQEPTGTMGDVVPHTETPDFLAEEGDKTLAQELDAANRQIIRQNAEMARQAAEIRRLNGYINSKVRTLTDRLAKVDEMNETLRQRLENTNREVVRQAVEAKNWSEEVERKSKRIQNQSENIERQSKEIERLNETVSSQKNQSEKIKSQSKEIERLNETVSSLKNQQEEIERKSEEIRRLNGIVSSQTSQQDAWTSGFSPDAAGLRKIAVKFASMVDKTCANMTDKDLCIICMTKPRDVALQPCGHLCCCVDCSSTLRTRANPKCPVCRGDFKDAVRVFT